MDKSEKNYCRLKTYMHNIQYYRGYYKVDISLQIPKM